MMKQAPPFALQIGMTFTGALIAIMVLLMVAVKASGYCTL